MGFMTSVEAGEKWNLSKRRVAIWLRKTRHQHTTTVLQFKRQ